MKDTCSTDDAISQQFNSSGIKCPVSPKHSTEGWPSSWPELL